MMLVLSRLRDERIMIGDEIEILVVDVCGNKVRLGIKAPPQVQIHRMEVYEAIKKNNLTGTKADKDGLPICNSPNGQDSGCREP
jgi:carbon storage regulator